VNKSIIKLFIADVKKSVSHYLCLEKVWKRNRGLIFILFALKKYFSTCKHFDQIGNFTFQQLRLSGLRVKLNEHLGWFLVSIIKAKSRNLSWFFWLVLKQILLFVQIILINIIEYFEEVSHQIDVKTWQRHIIMLIDQHTFSTLNKCKQINRFSRLTLADQFLWGKKSRF